MMIESIETIVPDNLNNYRLDQALATLCPQFSRSQIQIWIRNGFVTVNHTVEKKTRFKVQTDQTITLQAVLEPKQDWNPEKIALDIIYEDEDLLVINKPIGLVVHPGAGNPAHTLVNALLHYDPQLRQVPRAGLIHRLDKNTSGLLVIARHLSAHHYLVDQLQQRLIKREYSAIIHGKPISGGVIKTQLGRHPQQRTKMSVVQNGKLAITHYRIIERYRLYSHVHIQLETGRTHQIRVHFAHIDYPLVGDPQYGYRRCISNKLSPNLRDLLESFNHQALHARQLTLSHPRTRETMSWTAPLPSDMQQLLEALKNDASLSHS